MQEPERAHVPCDRCGGTLIKPEEGAQYECEDCPAIVSPHIIENQRP